MNKALSEGTGPPEWTQQPQISVSLQEGGGVGVMGRISNLTPKKSCELIVKNHSNKPCTGYNNMNYCMI